MIRAAACLLLAGALTALAVTGVQRHEARRALSFVGLPDTAANLHPAREIEVAFRQPVPFGTTARLDGPDGMVEVAARHLPEDPASLMVAAVRPLDWDTPYRLCIERPRRASVQRVLGPRQNCLAFHTQTRPDGSGPANAAILVVKGVDSPFAEAYGAILSAEGLTDHATLPADALTADRIAGHDVILLATATLPDAITAALSDWVQGGGLLLAMRPDPALLAGLGLPVMPAGRIHGGSVTANPNLPATRGLTPAPLGLHGTVELFDIPSPPAAPEAALAALSSEPEMQVLGLLRDAQGTRLPYPAGVLVRRGAGAVAALPFDLAETVMLTRQGNPRWVDQDRDGSSPRRPNDLFYPDHVALDRMHVPQADEMQRLLANVIMTAAPHPVPRLWYLPDRRRAVVVMTGDDHATPDGTRTLFAELDAASPDTCRPELWDCLRATSYLSPGTPFAPAEATAYAAKGFEVGVHVDSGCRDTDDDHLAATITDQLAAFRAAYPDLPRQTTERLHCIVWNGWVVVPLSERAEGIRFDMNYYSWPPEWLRQRAGFMTGSGFPMPFMDENGRLIDIYQAATHMVNENGVPQDYGIATLLDRALGPDQYFGAFGAHADFTDDYASRIVAAATMRGVALVTARQMLDWTDARNASTLHVTGWQADQLHFTATIAAGAERATALLPETFGDHGFGLSRLASITCNGTRLSLAREEIKGIPYVAFHPEAGSCTAAYGPVTRGLPVGTRPSPL